MKKTNFSLLIGMLAFTACQKEQSAPMQMADQVSQSTSSTVRKTSHSLPAALTKHLVAYYPFCGNANDISGKNNNPSFNSATLTEDRFGNANSAYDFNGKQYIKGICTNYPTKSRTISVWFKIKKDLTGQTVLGYGGGSCGTTFFACINEGDFLNAYTVQSHCRVNLCTSGDGYPPPRGWNNLVITTGNSTTQFYLNAVLIHTFENVDFNGTNVNGKDFAIGTNVSPGGQAPYEDISDGYFHGSLDDIVIYDCVLTSKEVKQLYECFSK